MINGACPRKPCVNWRNNLVESAIDEDLQTSTARREGVVSRVREQRVAGREPGAAGGAVGIDAEAARLCGDPEPVPKAGEAGPRPADGAGGEHGGVVASGTGGGPGEPDAAVWSGVEHWLPREPGVDRRVAGAGG